MSHTNDKGKLNYIKDTKNLISTRKETLVKNPQSPRGNPTPTGENRLPQGNKKFGPPSSSIERKHQTQVVSKRSSIRAKGANRHGDDQKPSNNVDIEQDKR